MERRVWDGDALAQQQSPDFREPHALAKHLLEERSLRDARVPRFAVLTWRRAAELRNNGGDQLVGKHYAPEREPAGLRRVHVAPHRSWIQPNAGRDPFFASSGQPLPEHFLDFDHCDLSERHRCLRAPRTCAELSGVVADRSRDGGTLLRNGSHPGGMLVRNEPRPGGNPSEKLSAPRGECS